MREKMCLQSAERLSELQASICYQVLSKSYSFVVHELTQWNFQGNCMIKYIFWRVIYNTTFQNVFEVVENSLLFMILMASCNKIMPPYLVPSANRLYIGGLVGRSSWPRCSVWNFKSSHNETWKGKINNK